MIKDMLKTGAILLAFTTIAGLMLAYCEQMTSPVIAKINLEKEANARKEVLPSAVSFQAAEKDVYIGLDKDSKTVGKVVSVSPNGYGGAIKMMVGIDINGRVTGTKILSHSETPGLGGNVVKDKFQNGFKKVVADNASPDFRVKKDGGDIDAITAATITSRAFCKGVSDAVQKANTVTEKRGDK